MSYAYLLNGIISHIYESILLIAAVYGILRYSKVDKSTRLICILIWTGAVTELIAKYFVVKFRNNYPVYGIGSLMEFTVINLYFNYSSSILKGRGIGWILAGISLLAGICNIVFLQPLHTINSNFILFECMEVIAVALYCLYRMLLDIETSLLKELHFWIICNLLLYQCGAFWFYGTYPYVYNIAGDRIIILNNCFLIINVLYYAAFTAILFLYPKLKRTYV